MLKLNLFELNTISKLISNDIENLFTDGYVAEHTHILELKELLQKVNKEIEVLNSETEESKDQG